MSGLKLFFLRREFGNAETDDLWTGLQTVVPDDLLPAGMTLKNVMDTWTLQSGYPVINVERLYDDTNRAIVTQV
jgi:aminopeptidase N